MPRPVTLGIWPSGWRFEGVYSGTWTYVVVAVSAGVFFALQRLSVDERAGGFLTS